MTSLVARCIEVCIAGVSALAVYYILITPTVVCLVVLAALWNLHRWEKRRGRGIIPLTDKHVLITGCDSGFGKALALRLHELDCNVIATVLLPEGHGARDLRDVTSPRMTVLPLDVSSDESVSECLRTIKFMCKEKGLWGLVNNAGMNMSGPVELVTMRQYLHVANVNIFGLVRTTRAFLPLIRQAKGRIVNVTSVQGRMPRENNGAYSITKFAGETFSDVTRLEMSQFGVKVIVIEPGSFGWSTGVINPERNRANFEEMWAEASDEVKQLYRKEKFEQSFLIQKKKKETGENVRPLIPVIDAMTEALTSGDPDFRYLIDGSESSYDRNCWMVRLRPYMSDQLFHRWCAWVFPYKI